MSDSDYEAVAKAMRRVRARAGDNFMAVLAIDACVDELRHAFLYDVPGSFDSEKFTRDCSEEPSNV